MLMLVLVLMSILTAAVGPINSVVCVECCLRFLGVSEKNNACILTPSIYPIYYYNNLL